MIQGRLSHRGMMASRRSLLSKVSLGLGGLALGCGYAWLSRTASAAATPDPSGSHEAASRPLAGAALLSKAPVFPLKVAPGKRHLVDAAGEPFTIHGDTAWSLIAELTREEVALYLDDRRDRGFNTILVNLIEHAFASNAPANVYGEPPFLEPGDYTTPNEAYFAHADWVLRQAADRGILVLLTPSYLGWRGGSSGWYERMVANGPDRLRAYGEYLGRRYRDFSNILWMHGGDYDPPERTLVRAIVQGIRTHDHQALHSSHMAPDTAALDYWKGEPWLDVNTVYTYGATYAPVLAQYSRPDHLPLFLIESAYENEHDATERRLRTQAYHALLSGAFGHVFGNNPIWHFGSGGLYPAPVTWPEALDSPGARSMTNLRKLMTAFPWWHLQPDVDHSMLTDGLGTGEDRAVAARSADGSLALIYLPSDREIVVGLDQLAGPQVVAHWYDPAAGRQSEARESPFQARGSRRFRPERPANQSGFDDWVLILQSHSAGSSQTEAGATL